MAADQSFELKAKKSWEMVGFDVLIMDSDLNVHVPLLNKQIKQLFPYSSIN